MEVCRKDIYLEEGDIIELTSQHRVSVQVGKNHFRSVDLSSEINADFLGMYLVIKTERVFQKSAETNKFQPKQVRVYCKQIKDQTKIVLFSQIEESTTTIIKPEEIIKIGKAFRCWTIPEEIRSKI